jgi:transcription initiation factor IIE alpha subunit
MAVINRKHVLSKRQKKSGRPMRVAKKIHLRKVLSRASAKVKSVQQASKDHLRRPGPYKERAEVNAPLSARKTMPIIATPEEVSASIALLFQNDMAMSFLKKNISKWSPDVLKMLTTPKTDEYLAEKLGMKINAVRRILNLLHGHGITNYYVSKNTGGWLSFAWYINTGKVEPFFDYINSMANEKSIVTNDCDDYFMCNSCYSKENVIFTFDSAFESSFRCTCGQKLSRMSKLDVENIIDNNEKETMLSQNDKVI